MSAFTKGRFNDFRGNGYFASWMLARGHLLLALRSPWRMAFVRPASKPHYRRLYIGPVEIEWSNRPSTTTEGGDHGR